MLNLCTLVCTIVDLEYNKRFRTLNEKSIHIDFIVKTPLNRLNKRSYSESFYYNYHNE